MRAIFQKIAFDGRALDGESGGEEADAKGCFEDGGRYVPAFAGYCVMIMVTVCIIIRATWYAAVVPGKKAKEDKTL